MAGGAIGFSRIPLIFVIDAPESTAQHLFEATIGAGGLPLTSAIYGIIELYSATIGKYLGSSPSSTSLPSLKTLLLNKIVLPFLVNPRSMMVAKRPTVVNELTRAGMLYQYYQAQPDRLTFRGRAAGNKAFFVLTQLDILAKTLETGARSKTQMIYKFFGIFNGYIDNVQCTIDGELPGVYDYSFDFQFADRNHLRIFSMALTNSALNLAINQPGTFIKDTMETAASEIIQSSGIQIGNVPLIK